MSAGTELQWLWFLIVLMRDNAVAPSRSAAFLAFSVSPALRARAREGHRQPAPRPAPSAQAAGLAQLTPPLLPLPGFASAAQSGAPRGRHARGGFALSGQRNVDSPQAGWGSPAPR